jgi:NAD(P)-binding Rossmann-like domain
MIIGGGIGGLCLAQGLRNASIDATVYERSLTRTDWLQGYRIQIIRTAAERCMTVWNRPVGRRSWTRSPAAVAALALPQKSSRTCFAFGRTKSPLPARIQPIGIMS